MTHTPQPRFPAPVQAFVGGLFVVLLAACGQTATPELAPAVEEAPAVESTLEIIDIDTGARRAVLTSREEIGAPNWSRDGAELIFNSGGQLYAVPIAGGERRHIPTGTVTRIVHDHAPSPDGTQIAFSAYDSDDRDTRVASVHVIPYAGGDPSRVTSEGPSYFHAWSSDGEMLAFTGRRGEEDNYDVYTIPAAGGRERRLTNAEGTDDGADYALDGTIYFNSARTGHMQIWKMESSGANQAQVTNDPTFNDWFPHPSPDGLWLIFLSYDGATEGLQNNQPVSLRIMPRDGSAPPRVLTTLTGGQGTVNAPSWAPNSRSFAFVSFRVIEE